MTLPLGRREAPMNPTQSRVRHIEPTDSRPRPGG
nr:MAG TPA: hypothetical protein [Caudoviricetes sp.]